MAGSHAVAFSRRSAELVHHRAVAFGQIFCSTEDPDPDATDLCGFESTWRSNSKFLITPLQGALRRLALAVLLARGCTLPLGVGLCWLYNADVDAFERTVSVALKGFEWSAPSNWIERKEHLNAMEAISRARDSQKVVWGNVCASCGQRGASCGCAHGDDY